MSHNLATNATTGGAAFVGTRKPAWHKLGTIVQEAMTAEQALNLAGLNYEVDKAKNYYLQNGVYLEHPNSFNTFRTDTMDVLGDHVRDRYEVVQNSTAFALLDEIAGTTGQATFEQAGALGKGERVWMQLRLPESVKVAGEVIEPYFMAMNSHDGSTGLILYTTPVRVVCQNTLNMSLSARKDGSRMYKIKHCRNYESRIDEAKRLFGFVRSYYESFEQTANILLSQEFSRIRFEELARTLLPEPEEAGRTKTRWSNQFELIMQAFDASDLNNVRGTKWGAYNAVADYSDHSRGVKGDEQTRMETLFTRSFEDTSLKDKALELLLV